MDKRTFEVETEEGESVKISPIGNDGSPITNFVGYRFWGKTQSNTLRQVADWLDKYGGPYIYHMNLERYSCINDDNKYVVILYRQEAWGLPLAEEYENA